MTPFHGLEEAASYYLPLVSIKSYAFLREFFSITLTVSQEGGFIKGSYVVSGLSICFLIFKGMTQTPPGLEIYCMFDCLCDTTI